MNTEAIIISEFPSFAKIVPYLTNPLVLIGFVLLLFFGIHKALIKSNILPPVSPTASNRIVRLILHYGFVVALVLILCGFGFAAYKAYLNSRGQSDVGPEALHEMDRLAHPLLSEWEVQASIAMPISGDDLTARETQKLYRYIKHTLSESMAINTTAIPAKLLPGGYDASFPIFYVYQHEDCDDAYANREKPDLELGLSLFGSSLSLAAILHAKQPSLPKDKTAMIWYFPSVSPPFGPMRLERDFKMTVVETSGRIISSKDVLDSALVFTPTEFEGFTLYPLSMNLNVATGVVLRIPPGGFMLMKNWESPQFRVDNWAPPVYCYTIPSHL